MLVQWPRKSIVSAEAPGRAGSCALGAANVQRLRQDLDLIVGPSDPLAAVRAPHRDEIPALRARARAAIGVDIAGSEVIARVLDHDPETVWAIERDAQIVGAFAFLFFDAEGVRRLRQAEIDLLRPPIALLAPPGQPPAGIYWWGVFGRGHVAAAMGRVLDVLRGPRHRAADMWSRPVTEDGARFFDRLGFRPDLAGSAGLYRYQRISNRIS